MELAQKAPKFIAFIDITHTGSIADVKAEIFGPVLQVVRWNGDPADVIAQINALGYGLTCGIQTRIDSRAQALAHAAHVGNIYINRNMIGAVVGVQPFGGEGLSGTGPKSGGPHYLYRFCAEQTITVNTTAGGEMRRCWQACIEHRAGRLRLVGHANADAGTTVIAGALGEPVVQLARAAGHTQTVLTPALPVGHSLEGTFNLPLVKKLRGSSGAGARAWCNLQTVNLMVRKCICIA